jgi:D-xylose transport system permease protein
MKRLAQGPWPVLVGTALLWLLFTAANPNFLSALNLTNLLLQVCAMGALGAGLVLVLLLGEMDLSAGAVSGLCGAAVVVLQVKHGIPGVASVGLGLLLGACVGLLHGVLITRLAVPSFMVTLAGLMTWQGAQLMVLGDTGSLNVRDPFILALTGTFLSWPWAFLLGGAWLLSTWRRDAATKLVAAVLAWLLLCAVFLLDRGIPLATVLLLACVTLLQAFITRTRLGRHVLAVGGNAEAARRAGIPVARVKVAVFSLCSMMAAVSGVLSASRLNGVTQSSGGGDLLLNAIAAAVMGGTSLFGGRGSVWSALWGALLIGSISNGMDLLALGSAPKFIITGMVLVLAVAADGWTRQQANHAGR